MGDFLECAKKTTLPELSLKFAPLRDRLVSHYLQQQFERCQSAEIPADVVFTTSAIPLCGASRAGSQHGAEHVLSVSGHAFEPDDDTLWEDLGVEMPATPY